MNAFTNLVISNSSLASDFVELLEIKGLADFLTCCKYVWSRRFELFAYVTIRSYNSKNYFERAMYMFFIPREISLVPRDQESLNSELSNLSNPSNNASLKSIVVCPSSSGRSDISFDLSCLSDFPSLESVTLSGICVCGKAPSSLTLIELQDCFVLEETNFGDVPVCVFASEARKFRWTYFQSARILSVYISISLRNAMDLSLEGLEDLMHVQELEVKCVKGSVDRITGLKYLKKLKITDLDTDKAVRVSGCEALELIESNFEVEMENCGNASLKTVEW